MDLNLWVRGIGANGLGISVIRLRGQDHFVVEGFVYLGFVCILTLCCVYLGFVYILYIPGRRMNLCI